MLLDEQGDQTDSKILSKPGYNERLFESGGLRSYLHRSRFRWFRKAAESRVREELRLIELGCFDGRLLNYCPSPPSLYEGFDAGWEGGLDLAKKRYAENENYQFIKGDNPSGLDIINNEIFDFGVAMDTLEHVPPDYVRGYLERLSRIVNGYIVITVPNEKGFIFLTKWLVKQVFYGGAESYTLSEIIATTLGHMEKITRIEHKGFDYEQLISDVELYFNIIKVDAIPFRRVPVSLSFTIGILAESK